jgi:hypothetical protein
MLTQKENNAWEKLKKHIENENTDNDHKRAFNKVIEEIAYTWFNRLIALRFMEVNDYLPTRVRAMSSSDGGADPDIIKEALNIDLDIDKEYVYNLKQNNKRDELYKYMIIQQCKALQDILPFLFDKTHDYVELLFPDNLLSKDSIIDQIVNTLPEKDWEIVEIIGWLYQYYISERKSEVFKALKDNHKIQKEDIAPATQLFTPEWIVRYMVENSLGRLWAEGHKTALTSNWKYYVEEAEQEETVEEQLSQIREESKKMKLEDIKILDPCMGSGHILVYAFDLLYDIYEEQGYLPNEIPKLIIERNLYGVDIDYRATQLAYFAVMMKGRSRDKLFFKRSVKPNLYNIEQSNQLISFEYGAGNLDLNTKHKETANYLIEVFKDAKEYGSLISVEKRDYDGLLEYLYEFEKKGFNTIVGKAWSEDIKRIIPKLIELGELLSNEYDIVCTNPPYMGSRGMNSIISDFVRKNYSEGKSDLFAVFIKRCEQMVKKNGIFGTIVQPSVLALSSYKDLRFGIISNNIVLSLLDMGRGIFGIDFGSTTFVIRKIQQTDYKGTYFKLHGG